MRGSLRASLLAGSPVGVTTVGFAALAHASSGGTIDVGIAVGASIAVIALAAAVVSRVTLTFWRAAFLSLAAQPLLHLAFERGAHSAPGSPTAGGHAGMAMALTETGSSTHTTMLVAHMALALAAAIVARWGVRWLRTMPDVARALVIVERRVVVPVAMFVGAIPTLAGVASTPTGVSRSWDNRGPPV